jgi:hypothetical protein
MDKTGVDVVEGLDNIVNSGVVGVSFALASVNDSYSFWVKKFRFIE